MNTPILPATKPGAIAHAADVLRHNGVVAFPTDTVYGIGAMAFQPQAVESLYVVKGRENMKAIAVLIADVSELEQVTPNPGEAALRLAKRFWPGPVTLVVPRGPNVPDALSKLATIGVRVPMHPIALALLRETGPLGVTSANLSGEGNTQTVEDVLKQLNGRINLALDGGRTPGGVPSTVVDCTGPEPVILRPGPISQADVERALG